MRLKGKRDEDAKHTMKYLDTLKNEFKVTISYGERQSAVSNSTVLFIILVVIVNVLQEYSQLWVETNHTVSAYDEIKMCKSRTEAVNRQVDGAEEHLSNLVIHLHEVCSTEADIKRKNTESIAKYNLPFVRLG